MPDTNLSISDQELFRMAVAAEKNAYAPYSGFSVGAALLCSDGSIYTGCNIENSAFGAGICAERTAMSKAVSEGHREFLKIAVSGNGVQAWPCGICRQFMYEFSPDMLVITARDIDKEPDIDQCTDQNAKDCSEPEIDLVSYTLRELLPEGFTLVHS